MSVARVALSAFRSCSKLSITPFMSRSQPASVRNFASSSPAFAQANWSNKRFQDADISAASKRGIPHEFMSEVQAATLEAAKSGQDLIVQAKTGTGKTLAFLLPSVERLVESGVRGGVGILVISPTRELALQIEKEAMTLITPHKMTAQHAIGGTNIFTETQNFAKKDCDILVATPGRLLDHLENNPYLRKKLSNVQTVIYDEADRLLDTGFKKELEKIQKHLPPISKSQHLLFSATFNDEVKNIAEVIMNPGYQFITTLKEEELNTHLHVPQSCIVAPFEDHLAVALEVLEKDVEEHGNKSKAIIFLPTANQTALAYELFSGLRKRYNAIPQIYQLQSRLTQNARTRTAEAYRKSQSAWLFSSDVTARGVDFPNVTLVLQLGVPSSGEQYVHRIGRTARAGADGKGVIVLAKPELPFLKAGEPVKSINISQTTLSKDVLDSRRSQIEAASQGVDVKTMSKAYSAWLGYYKSQRKMFPTPAIMVMTANRLVVSWGWRRSNPPGLTRQVVGKMGMKGVPGLNIVSRDEIL